MRRLVAVLAAFWIAAACGALPTRYATNEEILGPWRADPLSPDPATIAAAEKACQLAGRMIDAGGLQLADRLVAVDARGGGRLTLMYVGPGDAFSECALNMDARGDLSLAGSSILPAVGPPQILPANEVRVVAGASMTGPLPGSTSVTGRIGAAVTAVRVVIPGGDALRASVGGGWFTAWWPGDDKDFAVEAFDATGRKVGESGQ